MVIVVHSIVVLTRINTSGFYVDCGRKVSIKYPSPILLSIFRRATSQTAAMSNTKNSRAKRLLVSLWNSSRKSPTWIFSMTSKDPERLKFLQVTRRSQVSHTGSSSNMKVPQFLSEVNPTSLNRKKLKEVELSYTDMNTLVGLNFAKCVSGSLVMLEKFRTVLLHPTETARDLEKNRQSVHNARARREGTVHYLEQMRKAVRELRVHSIGEDTRASIEVNRDKVTKLLDDTGSERKELEDLMAALDGDK